MKNLLLSAIMLFIVSSVMAQLYVKPNGTTDTYIYVKDEVLFVEQDITLNINPTATQESSIYLREDAQLIQGTAGSANAGLGTLSVLQNTPDSDRYDYTYWCSPVGNINVVAGNRSFGLARLNDYNSELSSDLALITSSVDGIESPLTISKKWIFRHPRGQEAIDDYIYVAQGNTVPPGHGFTMKGVGTINHDQLYDFRGRANNGDMTFDVYTDEWMLSGNPYPSALDLNWLFWDTDNTELSEFRFWDEDHDVAGHTYIANRGGYGIWVPGSYDAGTSNLGTYTLPTFSQWEAGGTTAGTGSPGVHYERRMAPIGQGIMFVADADGTVTIKNSHRRYIKEGATSQFRGPLGATIGTIDEGNYLPQIRLNTYFGESHGRQMVLLFSEETTDGFDRGFDGQSPMDATSEVFFPVEKDGTLKPFVINTVPFDVHKAIPLTFNLDAQHTVKMEGIDQKKLKTKVYLFDRIGNMLQEISNGQIATVFLNAGVYENRFFIVFEDPRVQPSITSRTLIDEFKADVSLFQNNPAKQLEVANPEGYDVKEISIYDMSGKLVLAEKNLGKSNQMSFPTSNFSDGVYLVKLNIQDNISIDYKINVFNK